MRMNRVDSDNKDKVGVADSDVTPISKSLDDIDVGGCEASSTKEPKLVSASKVDAVAPVVTSNTPNSLGKRAAENVVSVVDVAEFDGSTPKEPKLVRCEDRS
ncbi:uncharacterized protein [Medicago truncatula]|uniref:uncharacterized protein n=1 Tax=Medicago truncatula TaxID=3880 RepID=UPI000D2F1A86|nr:uncharacterized protein LOC112419022 [Medicago truncatula]